MFNRNSDQYRAITLNVDVDCSVETLETEAERSLAVTYAKDVLIGPKCCISVLICSAQLLQGTHQSANAQHHYD